MDKVKEILWYNIGKVPFYKIFATTYVALQKREPQFGACVNQCVGVWKYGWKDKNMNKGSMEEWKFAQGGRTEEWKNGNLHREEEQKDGIALFGHCMLHCWWPNVIHISSDCTLQIVTGKCASDVHTARQKWHLFSLFETAQGQQSGSSVVT